MTNTGKTPRPSNPTDWLVPALIGLALLVLWSATLIVQVGNWLAGDGWLPTWNPFAISGQLLNSAAPIHATTIGIALVLYCSIIVGLVIVFRQLHIRKLKREGLHGRAVLMGDGKELTHDAATERAVTGKQNLEGKPTGLLFARALTTGEGVWVGFRDTMVVEGGQGAGKTRAFGIPAIIDAPGAVVWTSNKRDLADATRKITERRGDLWLFDCQGINGYRDMPEWIWDPLTYCTGTVQARAMAKIFSDAARPPGAQQSGYWDPAAANLLGHLLLAAAKGGFAVSQVYLWATDMQDDTPVDILINNGFPLQASALRGQYNLPEKQRAGVFEVAATTVTFLSWPSVMHWTTPRAGAKSFVPAWFVRSKHDTLGLLSRTGVGDVAPLTSALIVAVLEAAVEYAAASPAGRMPTPMVVVGDEIANVGRGWSDLPNQFSYFGSHAILPIAMLQSFAQGVELWGEVGMNKLWSSATHRYIASGLSHTSHLRDVSELAGKYDHEQYSIADGKNGRTTTASLTQRPIMDVAALAALEPGHVLVFATRAKPVLARSIPVEERQWASFVDDSVLRYGPKSP